MLSHRKVDKDQLEEMAGKRAQTVRVVMVDELLVRPEQVVVEENLSGEMVDGAPTVEVELDIVDEDDEEIVEDAEGAEVVEGRGGSAG